MSPCYLQVLIYKGFIHLWLDLARRYAARRVINFLCLFAAIKTRVNPLSLGKTHTVSFTKERLALVDEGGRQAHK